VKTSNSIEPDIKDILDGKKPSTGKRFKTALLILAVAVAVVLVSISMRKSVQSQQVTFRTEAVKQGDLTVIVTATGTLEPTNQIEVGSELSGIIENINVDYNSHVKTGQILAKLDTSIREARVTQSRAALETAKATVLLTEATLKETKSKLSHYRKARELSDNRVPSQSIFVTAEAAFERAQADLLIAETRVSQAKATLDADETELYKAVIRSPINGLVLTRRVEEGQTVAASFATPVLFTIAEDLAEMELHVNVDEADIGQVKEGQQATFTVDAYPDRTFEAEIIEIHYGPETVEGVVTYKTVLKVDNTDLSLRPGMTATTDIVVKTIDDTLMVSNAALRFSMPQKDKPKKRLGLLSSLLPKPPGGSSKRIAEFSVRPGQYRIWILKDNEPRMVSVTTGVTDGIHTQIIEGQLSHGTEVIVSLDSQTD
jgi:HlyD family secretion protein